MHVFTAYPFFRLIIPFVAGIFCALFFGMAMPWTVAAGLAGGMLIALFVRWPYHMGKFVVMVLADAFLLTTGISLVSLSSPGRSQDHYQNLVDFDRAQVYVAAVTDVPAGKPKSIKVALEIMGAGHGDSIRPASGRMIAYVRPNRLTLRAADVIMISGHAETP